MVSGGVQLTGSVMGRVTEISCPLSLHSCLSGMLGTWTLNVTGPCVCGVSGLDSVCVCVCVCVCM